LKSRSEHNRRAPASPERAGHAINRRSGPVSRELKPVRPE
jgi:hypothetical protein